MKILSFIVLSGLLANLSGCVVATPEYGYVTPAAEVDVTFEPDVIIGGYYVGYYNPGYGYWTGYDGWDVNFYAYGHGGWGHYYRGAPRGAYGHYRNGPHYGRAREEHRHG